MRGYNWATKGMWHGLVGPSDEEWRDGGQAQEGLEVQAQGATTAASRAQIYGELMATCAECHDRTRD